MKKQSTLSLVWLGLRAFLLGGLAALAFAPFHMAFVLWLSFPALLLLLRRADSVRGAFALGWSFAFGMLTVGLHWIAGSLFVDIATFWWALPFAVLGLPALFALYYGAATALAWRWGVGRLDGALMFALLWFVADVLRGTMFTGFPWNLTGYAWGGVLPILQTTSLFGVYGLSLVTILLAVLPAFVFENMEKAVRVKRAGIVIAVHLVVLGGAGAWGAVRLANASDSVVPDVRLRLIQTAKEQDLKWRKSVSEVNFSELLALSFAPTDTPVTHIIWPETATAFFLEEEFGRRKRIAERMRSENAILTGVIRRAFVPEGPTRYTNSLIALSNKGEITADYDKVHLVPFGEYMPFRSVLPIPAIAGMGGDFSSGEKHHTLRVAGLPSFSPLICYEAIFPNEVTEKNDRPQFLLNLTNDAWYEHTIGPYQHFAIARVRALEEGLPLVRVANLGATGVVDPYGRITAYLGWDQPDFLDTNLPEALPGQTVFTKKGPFAVWGMSLFVLLGCAILRLRRRT